MDRRNHRRKLTILTELEGFDDHLTMLEAYITDSVVPGICTNDNCECTAFVEPDQSEGWCDCCESNTVASCMILAGII